MKLLVVCVALLLMFCLKDLADADVLDKLKGIPDEVEGDRVCTKEML